MAIEIFPLNYNRSGTISQGGGGIEADFVFTLQVDPVLLKNFVKKYHFCIRKILYLNLLTDL